MKPWSMVLAAFLANIPQISSAEEKCSNIITSDTTIYKSDKTISIVYLTQLSTADYSNLAGSSDFAFPIDGIPIGASASAQQELLSTVYSESQLNYSENDKNLIYISTVNEGTVNAYIECLKPQAGFTGEARNASQDLLTVRVHWNPGFGAKIKKIRVGKVLGGTLFDGPSQLPAENNFAEYIFLREKGKRFAVALRGQFDGFEIPVVVELPWIPIITVKPMPSHRTSKESKYNQVDGTPAGWAVSTGEYQNIKYVVGTNEGYFVGPDTIIPHQDKYGAACTNNNGALTYEVAESRKSIAVNVGFGALPACGGQLHGWIEWDEYKPVTLVDGVVTKTVSALLKTRETVLVPRKAR